MMQITVNEFVMLYNKYEHMFPEPPKKFKRLSKTEKKALKMMIFQSYLLRKEDIMVIASGGEHPLAPARTEDYSDVPQEVFEFQMEKKDDEV